MVLVILYRDRDLVSCVVLCIDLHMPVYLISNLILVLKAVRTLLMVMVMVLNSLGRDLIW